MPFGYAINGALTHGYATTIHKAQGATVDRCFVLVEETTSREPAYTAMSRGRLSNDVYVEDSTLRRDEPHVAELQPDSLQRLRSDLGRSIGQKLALEHVQSEPLHGELEAQIDLGLEW